MNTSHHRQRNSLQWTRNLPNHSSPSQFQLPPEATAVPSLPTPQIPVSPLATKKKNNFSIGDIKQAIDRMGGLDGIVGTMNKVQKVMQSVSQMAPVAKMLVGSLLPSKKETEEIAVEKNKYDWELEKVVPRKRSKRRYQKVNPAVRPSTKRRVKQRRINPTSTGR